MPPAPSRISTWPGPACGSSLSSMRRSSLAWIRQVSMIIPFIGPGTRLLPRVPAGVEALVGLVQMLLHRRARFVGIARYDRLQHVAMLGDRREPELWRVVVMLELREQRTHPFFPEHFKHRHQRAVAGRLGDAQVKQ